MLLLGANDMMDEITALLDANLERVDNLISLYGPTKNRRKTVKDTDILRSALVLLHASLEDYLRTLLIWRIDSFDEEILNKFKFNDGENRPAEKITLGGLSRYSDKRIADFIFESVSRHLEENQSFSHLGKVKESLNWCGITIEEIENHDFGKLHEMIERRHNIVHKADREDTNEGEGRHRKKSIKKSQVEGYISSVRLLSSFVSSKLDE